jgi:hypothetical protein
VRLFKEHFGVTPEVTSGSGWWLPIPKRTGPQWLQEMTAMATVRRDTKQSIVSVGDLAQCLLVWTRDGQTATVKAMPMWLTFG